MIRKTVEFATPGTRLSVAHRQLVIERPEAPRATLPIEDLGVVVVDHVQTTYTHSVFVDLLEAGATLVISGRNHLPTGLLLPLDAHHALTERHRAQASAPAPVCKQIWKALVRAKILQQGVMLAHFTGSDAGLTAMAQRVRSGDPDNLEAQAAQRYWPRLFDKSFRRNADGALPNDLLNYGYAIIRAAAARAIVSAGLIPTLGVFHKNRSNPFCLADDLIEPYRPFVDWRVKLILAEHDAPDLQKRAVRAKLLSLFNETIQVAGRRSPLLLAFHATATSLARAMTGGDRTIALPSGLPLELGPDDDEVT